MLTMPGKSRQGALPPLTTEEGALSDRLRVHVAVLAGEIGERNLRHPDALAAAARYIAGRFREQGLPVREERYDVAGRDAVNIEAELKGGKDSEEIVVVGAHYDSVPGSPGANDNASGIAAVLELARLLRDARPARTMRFVAFSNEEPPYFQTETMGSLVYARRAKERGEKIVGMLSLETIGYYSDRRGSQHYPPPLRLFYPDSADFIAFVGDLNSRKLVRRVIGAFRGSARIPSEGIAAPGWVMGMGWSDHWSFWQAGYRALMITDTALFRYPHYHEPSDTPDKLDYGRMARVVAGVGRAVAELARK